MKKVHCLFDNYYDEEGEERQPDLQSPPTFSWQEHNFLITAMTLRDIYLGLPEAISKGKHLPEDRKAWKELTQELNTRFGSSRKVFEVKCELTGIHHEGK